MFVYFYTLFLHLNKESYLLYSIWILVRRESQFPSPMVSLGIAKPSQTFF